MKVTTTFLLISQIVVPLLTIGFSGLLSVYLTHRLSATRTDKEFRLKRLEELFLSFEQFSDNYSTQTLPLMPVMQGQLSYPDAKKLTDKYSDVEAGKQLRTVEMLVRIYFPELRPAFELLIKQRDEIGSRFLGPFYRRVHQGDVCRDLALNYIGAIEQFHKAGDHLKEAIFSVADRIRS